MLSFVKYIIQELCPLFHFEVMPVGLRSTFATRSFATLAPLPALLGVHFCVVPSQLGSRAPLRPSAFGTTLRVHGPEDTLFRQARGTLWQDVAERCHLPGSLHLGITLSCKRTNRATIGHYIPIMRVSLLFAL